MIYPEEISRMASGGKERRVRAFVKLWRGSIIMATAGRKMPASLAFRSSAKYCETVFSLLDFKWVVLYSVSHFGCE